MKIYITGTSGFLGKQLVKDSVIQKNIDMVYCPIRAKKGYSGKERFDKLFSRFKKCKFVEIGNIPLDIDIIIFNAFSIKFNSSIEKMTIESVTPIVSALEKCSKLKNLKNIIFISTAFVQPPEPYKLNKSLFNIFVEKKNIIEHYKNIINSKLNWQQIKDNTTHPHFYQNPYIYTKILTENICAFYSKKINLPLSIIRPSQIAISTDGKYGSQFGSMSFAFSLKTPVIRTLLSRSKKHDQIPVDTVSSIIIKQYTSAINNIIFATSSCNLSLELGHKIINPNKIIFYFDSLSITFYMCRYFEFFLYQIACWFGFLSPKKYNMICLFYKNYDYFHYNTWPFEANYPIENIVDYVKKIKLYVEKNIKI
jgi:thioester reductase-like protein